MGEREAFELLIAGVLLVDARRRVAVFARRRKELERQLGMSGQDTRWVLESSEQTIAYVVSLRGQRANARRLTRD
jgi:hypothetical protein